MGTSWTYFAAEYAGAVQVDVVAETHLDLHPRVRNVDAESEPFERAFL
jgi:hypothetical protein